MDRRAGVIATVISAALFGSMAVLASLAYQRGAEPLPLLTWRFLAAASLLAVVEAARGTRRLVVERRTLARLAAVSLFGHGASAVCFFYALSFADASVVAVLLYTYPAFVVLLEWLVSGTRLDAPRAVALAVTFAGCVLVVGAFSGEGWASVPGILLGIGSGLGYAGFTFMSSRLIGTVSRGVLTTYMFAFDFLLVVALGLVLGVDLSPAGWSADVWFILSLIVAVPTLGAVLLYLRGIRMLGPGQAALVSTLEPVFTVALAALLLGERLTPTQLLGAALVLAGVVIAEGSRRRPADVAIV
jgi:drug/metabolite transporter (DMT)-like permease